MSPTNAEILSATVTDATFAEREVVVIVELKSLGTSYVKEEAEGILLIVNVPLNAFSKPMAV